VQHCFATGTQWRCKVEEQRHLAAIQDTRQSCEQSDLTLMTNRSEITETALYRVKLLSASAN